MAVGDAVEPGVAVGRGGAVPAERDVNVGDGRGVGIGAGVAVLVGTAVMLNAADVGVWRNCARNCWPR